MHKLTLGFLAVCAVTLLLAVPFPQHPLTPTDAMAQGDTTVLKIQASFPPSSLLFTNMLKFARGVEEMSGGRVKIDGFPAGAIVGAFDVADATHRGVLDGAHTCTYYFMGKHMAAALFTSVPGGPFGMSTIDFWGWEFQGGGFELLNEFYQQILGMNIVAFPIFPTTPQSLGWFKKPLTSVDDLKGLKYRVPGLASEVYKDMGLSVVTLPGGEVLPAGERGVLDATEWYTPAEDLRQGFDTVWKFYHYPGAHEIAGSCDLLINKDVWDNLSPELQAIVKAAAFQAAFQSLLEFNRMDAEALNTFTDKRGVTLVKTPDDILLAHLKSWDKIAARESAKDPFFKKVLDSQRAYAELVVPARLFMSPYDTIADYYWGDKQP